ncbi:MAG: hypothetical protein QOE51_2350, partial [Actinoplanes sp.]|nr:hypothetical protein [Actinoplanes sp.]
MSYLESLFGLTGRTAVVTGGSSGIGLAMARALSGAGARVTLVARRPEPLAEAVERIGGATTAVAADLADRGALDRIPVADILVNAAAVNRRPPLDRLTEDDWDVTLAANL